MAGDSDSFVDKWLPWIVGAGLGLLVTVGLFLIMQCTGCTFNRPAPELGPSVKTHRDYITIWTHGIGDAEYEYVEFAAKILREDVFENKATCPGVVVNRENTGTLRDGINIYDDVDGPGTQFNNCDQIYAAMTKSGRAGIINLCGKRIIDWAHALHPTVYIFEHNIAKLMGLPVTRARGQMASYTSQGSTVMVASQPFSTDMSNSLFFGYYEEEKKALRARYCR